MPCDNCTDLQASLAASAALSELRRAALDEMYMGAIARIGLDKTRAKYSRQYAVLAAATPSTALADHDRAVKVKQLRELAEKFKAMSDRMNQSTGLGNWAYSHAYGRCKEIVLTEATRLEGGGV